MKQNPNAATNKNKKKGFKIFKNFHFKKNKLLAYTSVNTKNVPSSQLSTSIPSQIGFSCEPSSPAGSAISGITAGTGLNNIIPFSIKMTPLLPAMTTDTSVSSASRSERLFVNSSRKITFVHGDEKDQQRPPQTFISKSSWLSRTKNFQSLVQSTFTIIDTNNSGYVNENELYYGLLHIHLHLTKYLGAAACKPPMRSFVIEVFNEMDTDKSGEISKEEFSRIMTFCCCDITSRLTLQWLLALVIIPLISQFIMDILSRFTNSIIFILLGIDSVPFGKFMERYIDRLLKFAPGTCYHIIDNIQDKITFIPMIIVICSLWSFLIPWTMFKIESTFNLLS